MFEELLKFYNAMTGFDNKYPIAIWYNNKTNVLTYMQISKTVMTSGVSHMYLPKDFELGVMTPAAYNDMMNQLANCMTKGVLNEPLTMGHLDKLKLTIFRMYPSNPYICGPQVFATIKFAPIINKWLAIFILKTYSHESRILYKLVKNARKLKSGQSGRDEDSSESNQQEQKSSAS